MYYLYVDKYALKIKHYFLVNKKFKLNNFKCVQYLYLLLSFESFLSIQTIFIVKFKDLNKS